jgi:outer membrane protein OmpA-like peptidoglycan-associated protein
MVRKPFIQHLTLTMLLAVALNGCYHPPYNNFKPYNPVLKDMAVGAGVGTVTGAAIGTTLVGTGIGAAAGTARGLYRESRPNIIRELQKKGDIQYVQYGDTMSLIVPTDRYFLFNSPRFNELCYDGLNNIVRLLKYSPNSIIYVAGFTDNIGSKYHKNTLSQAQAETMLTFLWANGIKAQRLHAEGYGDKNDVSDNHFIHGSAQNRRLEIQWVNTPIISPQPMPYLGPTK